MAKFRFQDLEIWQLAIEIADDLFDIADELDKKKLFRFAEQLRAAGMSIGKYSWKSWIGCAARSPTFKKP